MAGMTLGRAQPGISETLVHRGAGGDEDGLIALILEGLQGEIVAPFLAQADIDPHAQDGADLVIKHILGDLVVGDAVAQHAAELGGGLEDRDIVALAGKVVGAGQAGGTAADNGDLFAGGGVAGNAQVDLVGHAPVGDKALQMVDGHRLIHENPAAAGLAEPGAYPPHGKGKGVALHDQAQGLFVLAFGHMGDIALHIDLPGTGEIAGRLAVAEMGLHQEGHALHALGLQLLGVGGDPHPFAHRGYTGPHRSLHPFHADHADLARNVRGPLVHVAQGGDMDIRPFCRFQDGDPFFGNNFIPVDCDIHSRFSRCVWLR